MVEKNYLTREAYKLWQYIKEKEIVDSELIKIIFPEIPPNKKNKLLYELYKKGYLKRAKKDLYYNPDKLKNLYKLALRIKKGYIGLSSALRYHNLLDYEDFTITVITRSFRKKIPLQGTKYEIQYIPFKKYFTGYMLREDISISTVEKTVFDCFVKPREIGFVNITKALYDAPINWYKFMVFFREVDNSALCQRTGYILEMMKKDIKLKIPAFVFEYLAKRVKNPVKLMPVKGRSVYNHKWKIQDTMGREKILSWWQ